jgi:uncharacterized protein YeaO (DUF488 family)
MLKTKSILLPKNSLDGVRISIMSRHTLNDGITPHPDINNLSYDLWLPNLAPPIRLLGDYYKRNLPWEKFECEYLAYLKQKKLQIEIQNLAKKGLDDIITLMCVENSPDYCHRRLIAEECKKYAPNLVLEIE